MLWAWLSLLTAVAAASQDAWIKRHFSSLGPFAMAAFPLVYGFPLYALSLYFVPVPALDAVFYACYLASLPLNGIAFLIYMNAILFARQRPVRQCGYDRAGSGRSAVA